MIRSCSLLYQLDVPADIGQVVRVGMMAEEAVGEDRQAGVAQQVLRRLALAGQAQEGAEIGGGGGMPGIGGQRVAAMAPGMSPSR